MNDCNIFLLVYVKEEVAKTDECVNVVVAMDTEWYCCILIVDVDSKLPTTLHRYPTSNRNIDLVNVVK